jgi:hypothetical protein
VSVYKELKLLLSRTVAITRVMSHEKKILQRVVQPLTVTESRPLNPEIYGGGSVSYHEEGVELTLPELLTLIVQGMEQLGVEFKIHAAQPAVPAMATVAIRPIDISAQMQNAAPNHLGKTATEGAL